MKMPMNSLAFACFLLCANLFMGMGNKFLSDISGFYYCFVLFCFVSLFFNVLPSLQIFESHLNLGTSWHIRWIYCFSPVARIVSPFPPNNVDFESDNATNCVLEQFH